MTTELPATENLFSDKSNQATLLQSREFQIMFEYETLVHYMPNGVIVMPDFKSIHLWYGVIVVKSGSYAGGVFKFTVDIPQNYPLAAPRVFFNSQVFHPLVDSNTGELNLNPKFPSWRAKRDFIFMVLIYIKAIFLQEDLWTESNSRNKEAFHCCKNKDLLKENQRKTSELRERPSNGIIHKFNIEEKPDEESDTVFKEFKKIQTEDHIRGFLEWFNDKYRVIT